jgi:hypothetical protein
MQFAYMISSGLISISCLCGKCYSGINGKKLHLPHPTTATNGDGAEFMADSWATCGLEAVPCPGRHSTMRHEALRGTQDLVVIVDRRKNKDCMHAFWNKNSHNNFVLSSHLYIENKDGKETKQRAKAVAPRKLRWALLSRFFCTFICVEFLALLFHLGVRNQCCLLLFRSSYLLTPIWLLSLEYNILLV